MGTKKIPWLILVVIIVLAISSLQAQGTKDRPIYFGGIGKFIGGLGVHVEFPVNQRLTFRGEAGWLIFILDINAGIGYEITPRLELYSTFHATLMSFISSTVAYGPELGIDLRITEVFHIEGGAVYLMNESTREWLPNVGITLNLPLRP